MLHYITASIWYSILKTEIIAPEYLLEIATILLLLLLLLPVGAYLWVGWRERRSEILAELSQDSAIESYFTQFHPKFWSECKAKHEDSPRKQFLNYYSHQFGRRYFVMPLLLLSAIAGLSLTWGALSVGDWLFRGGLKSGDLPWLAVAAIMGAYMYSSYDLIDRWNSDDLSPTDLLWPSFRFVIAVPSAYAISSLFTASIAPAVAFLLGAFPTTVLMKIVRRLAAKHLDVQLPESDQSELRKLQGIDVRNAERLASEGITTILQLAYIDPVKIAIRTNLSFSAVVDFASQALLWIYLTDDLPKVAKVGLRGAWETLALYKNLRGFGIDKETDKEHAEALLKRAAARLNYESDEMENIWKLIWLDPCASAIQILRPSPLTADT